MQKKMFPSTVGFYMIIRGKSGGSRHLGARDNFYQVWPLSLVYKDNICFKWVGKKSPNKLASSSRWIPCIQENVVSKWVFPKIMVPKNGWFIMENPIKIHDLGGYHDFWKHPNHRHHQVFVSGFTKGRGYHGVMKRGDAEWVLLKNRWDCFCRG